MAARDSLEVQVLVRAQAPQPFGVSDNAVRKWLRYYRARAGREPGLGT
jgi:hypothetical protein